MVKKLFYDDQYQKEFEAKVTVIDGNNVELDQTCFYPEGGGQAGDTGSINGIEVIDTQKDKKMGLKVIHILEKSPNFKVGDKVHGKIDWEKRYRTMRLHSAAHLMEYFFYQVFGKQKRIGSSVDYTKDRSDYESPERLNPEKLKQVQDLVNEFIKQNHEITTWADKNNSEFRYWKADKFEEPCGGTHPRNTKEIGNIKLKRKNYGKGIERIETTLDEEQKKSVPKESTKAKKKETKKSSKQSKPSYHWTDIAAENIIRQKGDKPNYTVAAGITPSGTVHIGNFREIITVELVKRALEKKGKKVRFIYSWDDYDVFRKVPKNMPKQEELKANLRKSIVDVPDPHEKAESYARHQELKVENDVKRVGIEPEFLYQAKQYRKCTYTDGIIKALKNTDKIKAILNNYRENPLADDWLPIAVFTKKDQTDEVTNLTWDGKFGVSYTLKDGSTETVDIRKDGNVKLKWRVDWPMRWAFENVDFEPGGKDHSTTGGSFDTGKQICKEVYGQEAPTYVMYNFINVRGASGKMSSSTGDVVSLHDVLEIYEPEVVRYIFAGTRPNREFSIAFDTDVLALYEEFDKVERTYYGLEEVNDKKKEQLKVAYELSYIGKISKTIPYQPSFRHLTTILQIYDFDIEKVIGYFEKQLKNEHDKSRLRTRAQCAANWVQKHAPEDFKFKVQDKCQVKLVKQEKEILHQVAEKLMEKEWTDKQLHEELYILCTNEEFPSKDFFKLCYRVLVNKDKGPRLASFILEIGKERVAELFKSV